MCDPAWHLSSDKDNSDPIKLGQNKYISFMDVSQGVVSHQWIVPEGEGIYFIDGAMDYNTTDYSSMIISNPYTTDKKTVNLYFTEPGDFTITLLNTFLEATDYKYTDADGNIQTVSSTLENGQHVIRKKFPCHVYAGVLEPSALVYRYNELTDAYDIPVDTGYETNGAYKNVWVEYGESLYFVDDSYEAPNSWTWNCYRAGVLNETGETIEIAMKASTTANTPLIITQTVERKSSGSFVPIAAAVQKDIPLNIYVTPTDNEIEMSQPYQVDDKTIYIELGNAEFDASTLSTGANGFTLSYVNGDKSGNITISEVSTLATNATILKLTLAESIYNTDTLTLKYSGNIEVLCNTNTFKFTKDQIVKTTLLDGIDYDFEDDTQLDDWKLTYADVTNAALTTSELSIRIDTDGNKYLYADCSDDTTDFASGSPALIVCTESFTGEITEYKLNFKYKVLSTVTGWASGITCSVEPSPYTFNAGWFPVCWMSTLTEWTTWTTTTSTPKSSNDNTMLFFRSGGWRGEIAIDNVTFNNAEPRP